VDELELVGDSSPLSYTAVVARFLYDNARNEPVLGNLQNIMANRMGPAAQYHVAFSAGEEDSWEPSTYPQNGDPPADCTSVYGDSARVLNITEFLAATAGGVIGTPYLTPGAPPPSGQLQCGGSVDTAYLWEMGIAYASPTPALIDLHTKPTQVSQDGSQSLNTDVQGQATMTFNALKRMFDSYGPTDPGYQCPQPGQYLTGTNAQCYRASYPAVYNMLAVFGETWKPVSFPGPACGTDPTDGDTGNYYGFTSSNMAVRPSVMVPFVNLVNGCFTFPPTISPPYVPVP